MGKMNVLVLGGAGFLGRHVVASLRARGHAVIVGTRHVAARRQDSTEPRCEYRHARFERLTRAAEWGDVLRDVDAVVNCVGILRERGAETYDSVHHRAPAALADACARLAIRRLVHVSALGLGGDAKSGFIRSKRHGERVIAASAAAWTIVRPSLLDGEGGYGARWLRRVASWPVHFVPRDAVGRMAVLDVGDAGAAIAILAEAGAKAGNLEAELGGPVAYTMAQYLAALRALMGREPVRCVSVPASAARLSSHVCDLVHCSPFSFGHLELMRRDNLPRRNAIRGLLGRAPRMVAGDRATAPSTASPDAYGRRQPAGE